MVKNGNKDNQKSLVLASQKPKKYYQNHTTTFKVSQKSYTQICTNKTKCHNGCNPERSRKTRVWSHLTPARYYFQGIFRNPLQSVFFYGIVFRGFVYPF